jgi:hypothetical protein
MVKKNEIIEILQDYMSPIEIERYLDNKEMFRKAIEDIDERARVDAIHKIGFGEFIKTKIQHARNKRLATIVSEQI